MMNYIGVLLSETDEHIFDVATALNKDLLDYSLIHPNTTVVVFNVNADNVKTTKYLGAICTKLGLALTTFDHTEINFDDYEVDNEVEVLFHAGKFHEIKATNEVEALERWTDLIQDRVYCYGSNMRELENLVPCELTSWQRPIPE